MITERESKRKTKMRPDHYLNILQALTSVKTSLITSAVQWIFSIPINVYHLLHSLNSYHGLLAL